MVSYRLATEADYQKINDFHNFQYKSNRTLEQFYWEFHNGPFGKAVYVIAEDEGKIIGTNCVIPIDLMCSNTNIIKSGKSEDTLVDPEYRGQKIFYHIYQYLFEMCKAEGIDVIWGFTSASKPFINLGFSIPFQQYQSVAVNNIHKSYLYLSGLNPKNKQQDKAKIYSLCVYSKLKLVSKSSIDRNFLATYAITEDQEIIDGVDSLIQSNLAALPSSFAILQNSTFQKWRIYQNPNFHKTHTYGFFDKNRVLKGLIVLNSHSNDVAYICQSTFHGKLHESDKIEMIKYVSKRMFSKGISLIRNWQFENNQLNIQETNCYIKSNHVYLKRGIGFVWKNLSGIDVNPDMFFLSRISTQGVI